MTRDDPRRCNLCDVEYVMSPVQLSGELFPRYFKTCPKCTGHFDRLFSDPSDWTGTFEIREVKQILYGGLND
jgi:hypothetical protein